VRINEYGNGRTAVIIVAYNNPVELETLIRSLYIMNSNELKLFVLDNSDDEKSIINNHIISNYYKRGSYWYFKPSKNLGSAFGFHIAMKKAFYENYTWLWLLDQDMKVDKNSLIDLVDFALTKEYLVATQISRCIITGNEYPEIAELKYLGKRKSVIIPTKKFLCPTHGLLLNRRIIEKIGFYDYKNYFVGLEDFDYCMRIYKVKEKIGFDKESFIYHPSPENNIKRKRDNANIENPLIEKMRKLKKIINFIFPATYPVIYVNSRPNYDMKVTYSCSYFITKYYSLPLASYSFVTYIITLLLKKIILYSKVEFSKSYIEAYNGFINGYKDRKKIKVW